MRTYTVHIERIEHYTIEVQATDVDDAEEKAWGLFPTCEPDSVENNAIEVSANAQE